LQTKAKLAIVPVLLSILALGSIGFTQNASAIPVSAFVTDGPNCDFLPATSLGHELGIGLFTIFGPPGPFPIDEEIDSIAFNSSPICVPDDGDPFNDWEVSITNLSPHTYVELHFVADDAIPVGNFDGFELTSGPPTHAFRIDDVGVNPTLLFEDIAIDGMFVPGETWTFVVDNFGGPGFPFPPIFDSVGFGFGSPTFPSPSTASILAIMVPNGNGEEEDFGDAPDTYSTLVASVGPQHTIPTPLVLFLGTFIDSELDGQPTADATGDDANGLDDEDGVVFTSMLTPASMATVDVTASVNTGLLNAWVDFNFDGDFTDAGEQIFTDVALNAGVNNLVFPVPALAELENTFARFRLDTAGGLAPTGAAIDGEVEDYQVLIKMVQPRGVGGEYFTLDQTALLLSGVQTNLAWLIPVLSAVGIGAFLIRKKF